MKSTACFVCQKCGEVHHTNYREMAQVGTPICCDQETEYAGELLESLSQRGLLTLEQTENLSGKFVMNLQIGDDGRIWLCKDGVAFLRFKPMNY